ncbi:MAG TPA: hypothetical protein VFQ65_08040 [Kofleriaceae bacterium]|nr:hypothetical protein [Kofleriaceae bacterium]
MKRLVVAAFAAGCQATVGTVDVSLVTAPGSTLLDGVETLRLVLTNPHQVSTATRTSGGFAIDLQLDASGDTGALIVDGLDASGAVIATGQSPPFPIGGLTANVAVYMAAPNSIGAAPVMLAPARSQLATGALSYGAVFAGGTLADGTPSTATGIYNAFDHAIQVGSALPAAKTAIALGVGTSGHVVYLFGGSDASGVATASVERFDTSVAPAGTLSEIGPFPGFERTGQLALSIGNENLLVTGAPIAELEGGTSTVMARSELASLPPSGAAVTASDGIATAVFAGPDGVFRFRNNTFDTLDVMSAKRTAAQVVALPGGQIGVACGGDTLARIDAATGAETVIANVPAEARTGCALAATTTRLVIAGGTDSTGAVIGTAEIFDAATFAPIATQPLVVPRTGATATALTNGQILIAGGVDAVGAPIATLELFTPDSPE